MKHKILTTLLATAIVSLGLMMSKCISAESTPRTILPIQNTTQKTIQRNDVWCVTFQLVWNEFMKKVNGGKAINFVGGNPELVNELNKQNYTKDDISPNSYYLAQGKISKRLKKDIEKSIQKKFKEKSDILDMIDWNAKNSYLFYAMLKKEFNFLVPFDKLTPATFNNSTDKVKYFGIRKNGSKAQYKNVDVIFYNNPNDFAIKLATKENEEVILYRTDSEDSFETLYSQIKNTKTLSKFTSADTLRIPEINVDKTISYSELCNKQIEGSNIRITQALQTIKFKMDNKGGKLKSEAAITIMRTSLQPENNARYFILDKPFVMFIKEQSKNKPYYAMKIDNVDYLVKE